MAQAIRYLLKNSRELERFLRFASIPPDNNIAEASLRRVALGRGNYLFFGNEHAGHDFAVIYTLVASCEKHGVNAIDYLTVVRRGRARNAGRSNGRIRPGARTSRLYVSPRRVSTRADQSLSKVTTFGQPVPSCTQRVP
jgi:Transposase IS66 family